MSSVIQVLTAIMVSLVLNTLVTGVDRFQSAVTLKSRTSQSLVMKIHFTDKEFNHEPFDSQSNVYHIRGKPMKQISLRLPDALHAGIEKLAQREVRSVNSWIVYYLTREMDKQLKKDK